MNQYSDEKFEDTKEVIRRC